MDDVVPSGDQHESADAGTGQASPRDNVVFEAGLFGGALGIRRTFIIHANGSKLPSDLLGLTSVRYDPVTTSAEVGQPLMMQPLDRRHVLPASARHGTEGPPCVDARSWRLWSNGAWPARSK